MVDEIEIASALAGVLGVTAKEAATRLHKAAKAWRAGRTVRSVAEWERLERDAGRRGLVVECVRQFYGREPADAGWADFVVDGRRSASLLASRAEWQGLRVPMNRQSGERVSIQQGPPSNHIDLTDDGEQLVLELTDWVRSLNRRLWDNRTYYLEELSVGRDALGLGLSVGSFYDWRFTYGLLWDEVVRDLIETDFGVVDVARDPSHVRLRRELLPDWASLLSGTSRACIGGPVGVLALARPRGDFALYLQRRKENVSHGGGQLASVPRGFHQPMVDSFEERFVSATLFRELYEELFGGDDEVEDSSPEGVRRWNPDWWIGNCPAIAWLMAHPADCVVELLNFGFDGLTGNCTFGVLIAVTNEDFYTRFAEGMRMNWEAKTAERVSTKGRGRLARLLADDGWLGDNIPVVVESLLRLNEIAPERVSLPEIGRV